MSTRGIIIVWGWPFGNVGRCEVDDVPRHYDAPSRPSAVINGKRKSSKSVGASSNKVVSTGVLKNFSRACRFAMNYAISR